MRSQWQPRTRCAPGERAHLLLLPASLRKLHLLQIRICRPRGKCARQRGSCRHHWRPSPPPELPAWHWCTRANSVSRRQRLASRAIAVGRAPGDGASGSKQAYTAGSSARDAETGGSGQAYTLSGLLGAAQTTLTRDRVTRALRAPGAQQRCSCVARRPGVCIRGAAVPRAAVCTRRSRPLRCGKYGLGKEGRVSAWRDILLCLDKFTI